MKTKHKLNVILSILLSLSMLQVPVFASEVSGTVSEDASVFEEVLETSESDALAGEESVDGALYAGAMVPISEDLSEASGSTRSNDSEWITADISNLLYMTGAFPKPEDFDYTGCPELDVFENLSDKDEFSGLIYNAIKDRTNLSNVSGFSLTPSQVSSRVATVINQTPEFFYANKSYQYCLNNDGNVSQIILFPENININRRTVNLASTDGLDQNTKDRILEEKANEIISEIDPCWCDEQIALYLYQWLQQHCVYDDGTCDEYYKGNYNYKDGIGYTAYGAIVLGCAVCQGTSLAYELLMNKAGVPCTHVYDDTHAWNLIRINDKNYHVDATAGSKYYRQMISYDRLMLSTEAYKLCRSNTESSSWYTGNGKSIDEITTSTDHDDYYWNHGLSNIIIPQNRNLVAYDHMFERETDGAWQENLGIHDYINNKDIVVPVTSDRYCHIEDIDFIGDYIAVAAQYGDIGLIIDLIDPSTNKIIDTYNFTEAKEQFIPTQCDMNCDNGIITYRLFDYNIDTQLDERGNPINMKTYNGTLDWSKYVNNPKTVTITFDSNGGSQVPAQTISYGSKATSPADPTNGNLYFAGWYTDKNLVRKFSFNAKIKWDTTLYAKWSDTKPEENSNGECITRSTVLIKGNQILDKDLKKKKSDKKSYKVKYSNKKVASVSTKGVIKAKKAGTTTITLTTKDRTVIYNITVVDKPALSFTQPLTKTGQTISISENCIVSADSTTITPVKYTSSKPSVATIDEKTGVITAGEKDGKAKITAYYAIKGKDGALKTVTTKGKLIVKHEQ